MLCGSLGSVGLRAGYVIWVCVALLCCWVLLNSVGIVMLGYAWLGLLFC